MSEFSLQENRWWKCPRGCSYHDGRWARIRERSFSEARSRQVRFEALYEGKNRVSNSGVSLRHIYLLLRLGQHHVRRRRATDGRSGMSVPCFIAPSWALPQPERTILQVAHSSLGNGGPIAHATRRFACGLALEVGRRAWIMHAGAVANRAPSWTRGCCVSSQLHHLRNGRVQSVVVI
jgi:hypothetical protein